MNKALECINRHGLSKTEKEFTDGYRENFKGQLVENHMDLYLALTEEAGDSNSVEIPAHESVSGVPVVLYLPVAEFCRRVYDCMEATEDEQEMTEMVKSIIDHWGF